MADPLDKCSLCSSSSVAFCMCSEPPSFFCSACVSVHSASHEGAQVLPMKAYGHHKAPGYVDRLRARIRNKEQGEDELMANLKQIGDCQKDLTTAVNGMTKTLSTYLAQSIAKLQRLKVDLETDINNAVAEVESVIYEDSPTLTKPLARALWGYSPGSLRIFKYAVKRKSQLDLTELMRYTYTKVETIPELTFAQEHQSFLDQNLVQDDSGEKLVISDDEEVEGGTDFLETDLSPNDLLTAEAKATHSLLAPLSLKQVAGVESAHSRLLPDGKSIYIGDWLCRSDGKLLRHGFGRLYLADGSLAEGYWKANFLHLTGRLVYANGDYYEGEFVKGLRDGIGTFQTLSPKTSFYGKWTMDKRNGYGHELMMDGTVYEGSYLNDEKTGEGKLLWRNGNTYTGTLVEGKFSGRGVYQWSDGRVYEGEWENNLMHGKGKFTYADGSTYEGEYLCDRKEGYGVYKWHGKVYEGTWKGGQMHGRGWVTLSTGAKSLYEFDMGKKISELG